MKKWVVKESAPESFKDQFAELEPIVADLLYHRGLDTQEKIDAFLSPDYTKDIHDPFLFDHMQEAIDRIKEAILKKEKITVHGDYDADGLGGSVVIISTLRQLGAEDVDVYLPDREKEGYGININTVDYLHEQNTKLIITTDCGISNVKEIAKARELGIDVIVTDHHTQPPELPDAIILHPKVEGESYPFKDLAGGGVAFKLAQGLLRDAAKDLPEEEKKVLEGFEKWLLDMVAVSSVADMVPLIGENRTLVKYGLLVLSKARRPGVQAMLTNAGILPVKGHKPLELSTYHCGFVLGPRLNAAGRLDHANTAYETLMADTYDDAKVWADKLEQTNKERQNMTKKITEQALQQIGPVDPDNPTVLFAYDPSWPMGVVGLIASRVLEKHYRPVFITSEINGKIAGSGRSIEGFDCVEALNDAKEYLGKYGGHERACGFTIAENNQFEALKTKFIQFAREKLTKDHLVQKIELDAELKVEEITWDFYEVYQKFAPFGMGNEEPKFVSYQAEVVEIAAIGADKNHLRLAITHDHKIIRKCIAFRKGEMIDRIRVGSKIDLIYTVDINEWNGNRELQLKVIDIRTK